MNVHSLLYIMNQSVECCSFKSFNDSRAGLMRRCVLITAVNRLISSSSGVCVCVCLQSPALITSSLWRPSITQVKEFLCTRAPSPDPCQVGHRSISRLFRSFLSFPSSLIIAMCFTPVSHTIRNLQEIYGQYLMCIFIFMFSICCEMIFSSIRGHFCEHREMRRNWINVVDDSNEPLNHGFMF